MKDGLDFLIQEHETIRSLFTQYEEAKTIEEKKKIVDQFIPLISQHASLEEQYLYPLFRTHIGGARGNAIADRNIMDDQVNKEIMYR